MTQDYSKILAPYREKIDRIDDQIVDLLVMRENIIREVAQLKCEHDIPPVLQDRVVEVRERNKIRAISQGQDGQYVENIFKTIIHLSCAIEEQEQEQKKETR